MSGNMKKPSILMIGNYLPTPKYNKNVWHYLAERLAANGWDVHTTSSKINKPLRLLDMSWTIIKRRNDFQIAQVDVFSGKAFFWAEFCQLLLRLFKKPLILTLHGGALPDFSKKHPHRVSRLLNNADIVVTPSSYLQQALSKYRAEICIIHNPIDLSAVIYRHREKVESKLIWLRSFHEIYNPTMAVWVLRILLDQFPAFQLIMVGPDKQDGSLQQTLQLAEDLQVINFLEITGGIPHTQVSQFLNNADIFINTSNYDNMPSSVLEAMACGLPIVSTNVGGIPDLIIDNVDGLLVPPNDPQAMANAIIRIIKEPNLAETISNAAHHKAQHHDWSVILPQWDSLLRSILEKGCRSVN